MKIIKDFTVKKHDLCMTIIPKGLLLVKKG